MSDSSKSMGGAETGALLEFITRVERLNEEMAVLAEDRSYVFEQAKNAGFDKKVMRRIISARKKDTDKRLAEDALFEVYANALGIKTGFDGTPLGDFADSAAAATPHDADGVVA